MASAAETAAPPSPSSLQSPVPFLFCGLAAMLGLIAFALLVLGCSYWKLHRSHGDGETRDVESDGSAKAAPPVVEEKYLVIMAGEEKPTFLATPCSRSSSFGTKSSFWIGSSETSLELEKNIEPRQSVVDHYQFP